MIWKPARWFKFWQMTGPRVAAWIRCTGWEAGAYGSDTKLHCLRMRGHTGICLSATNHLGHKVEAGHRFIGRDR